MIVGTGTERVMASARRAEFKGVTPLDAMWAIIIAAIGVMAVAALLLRYRAPRRNCGVKPYPARGHWWNMWDGKTDGHSFADSSDSGDSVGGDSGDVDSGGGD